MKRLALLLFYAMSTNIVHAQDLTALQKYISAAGMAMDNEQTDEAIIHFKKAIEVAPDNFVPYYINTSLKI